MTHLPAAATVRIWRSADELVAALREFRGRNVDSMTVREWEQFVLVTNAARRAGLPVDQLLGVRGVRR